LHLVCTVHGLVLGWALTGAKADEREVLGDLLTSSPLLARAGHHHPILIGDKNYYGKIFEADLADQGIELLRPTARASNRARAHASSNRCDRSSSRSTTPSKANSTSSATAPAPSPASAPESRNASSR
jgi:hypothetical protein